MKTGGGKREIQKCLQTSWTLTIVSELLFLKHTMGTEVVTMPKTNPWDCHNVVMMLNIASLMQISDSNYECPNIQQHRAYRHHPLYNDNNNWALEYGIHHNDQLTVDSRHESSPLFVINQYAGCWVRWGVGDIMKFHKNIHYSDLQHTLAKLLNFNGAALMSSQTLISNHFAVVLQCVFLCAGG